MRNLLFADYNDRDRKEELAATNENDWKRLWKCHRHTSSLCETTIICETIKIFVSCRLRVVDVTIILREEISFMTNICVNLL